MIIVILASWENISFSRWEIHFSEDILEPLTISRILCPLSSLQRNYHLLSQLLPRIPTTKPNHKHDYSWIFHCTTFAWKIYRKTHKKYFFRGCSPCLLVNCLKTNILLLYTFPHQNI